MATKKKIEKYAIGIIPKGNQFKYVTKVGEGHWANWEDGKEAILFTKAEASDMCLGFRYNGIPAVAILKEDYIILKNN